MTHEITREQTDKLKVPSIEVSAEKKIQKLHRLSDVVKEAGRDARAFYQFTDALVSGISISPERSIGAYSECLGFDRTSKNERITLLERIIPEKDRALFTVTPDKVIEEMIQRGGISVGGNQVILPDHESGRHSEAGFTLGERFMLSVPVTIPRAQYLFVAERQGQGVNIIEHIEFSSKAEGRKS